MSLRVQELRERFLERVRNQEAIYNNATPQYGLQVKTLPELDIPPDASQYWCVVGVHHLSGAENRGNHHIFCDVLDEAGNRINGARLQLTQGNQAPVFAVIDKPAEEPGTNFPLWSSDRGDVSVVWPPEAPLPSERAIGISTAHPDEEAGNTLFHHSFYLVFQRTNIPPAVDTTPATEPIPAPEEAPSPATPEPPQSDGDLQALEDAIGLAGQPLIIPLNRETLFYKYAQTQGLGERLTDEYEVEHAGRRYRAQIYEHGIVYAEVGVWQVAVIPRVN